MAARPDPAAPDVQVKICGLSRSADISAAIDAGADWLGFVFFAKSPRNLTFDDARTLLRNVPEGIAKVALTVDAHDDFLDRMLEMAPVDVLQLHGTESPERVSEIRARYGLPAMKAVGVSSEADLPALDAYGRVADMILVDAKPPPGAELPGGNGVAFDWRLIAGRRWPVPWMLAGGLAPGNVAEAIRLTGARQVDVSSGVESAPGRKDAALAREFVRSAKGNGRGAGVAVGIGA